MAYGQKIHNRNGLLLSDNCRALIYGDLYFAFSVDSNDNWGTFLEPIIVSHVEQYGVFKSFFVGIAIRQEGISLVVEYARLLAQVLGLLTNMETLSYPTTKLTSIHFNILDSFEKFLGRLGEETKEAEDTYTHTLFFCVYCALECSSRSHLHMKSLESSHSGLRHLKNKGEHHGMRLFIF